MFRLKAKTKVRQLCVRDRLYADDTGFVSHSEVDLQTILDRFAAASASFGLSIKSCINPLPGHRTQHRRSCSMVRHLTSLHFLNTLGAPSQTTAASRKNCMSARIQSASAAFGRLRERLWNKHDTKLVTKCKVYRAIILSCILYRSETYTLYIRHNQRLSQIHLRHLRAILGIRWSDRVTNNEALQLADMPSIEAMLLSRQLTWTGHVVRMNDDRLPKTVLYGEL